MQTPSSRAPVRFFHYSAKAASGKTESVMDVTFRADVGTARRNTAPSRDPDPSGAVVDLVCSGSQHPVTIGNSSGNSDFLIAITIRIAVNFCDVCLAGAGGEQQCTTDQNEENSGFFQC